MALNAAEIANYAAGAGFQGNDLTTAVAVALAESQGNPNAYNPEPQKATPAGKGSVGLWQIYQAAHPEFSGWDLTDPGTNATAAFNVYTARGNSFTDWSTFKNGRYLAYMDQAQAGVMADASAGAIDASSGLPAPVQHAGLVPFSIDLSQFSTPVLIGFAIALYLILQD